MLRNDSYIRHKDQATFFVLISHLHLLQLTNETTQATSGRTLNLCVR